MKRILYLGLCITVAVLILNGCSKSSDNGGTASTYYIKGKKNGAAFNFSANAMAQITNFSSTGGFISLALIANAQPNGASLEGLNIGANFFNGQAPKVGTYSEDYTGTDYLVAGVYNPNSTSIVWSAGIHYPTAKPLKIVIVSKTASEVTGTFEGAFYKQDLSNPSSSSDEYVLFTEGEFKLPVK